MNETTHLLSQLMGPMMVLLGASMLVRQDAYMEFIRNLVKNRSLLLYNGIIEGTAGLAVVLHHNLWSTPAQIIISLVGWGMLVEGIFDLFVSKTTIKDMASAGTGFLRLSALVVLIAGAYLTYLAYLI